MRMPSLLKSILFTAAWALSNSAHAMAPSQTVLTDSPDHRIQVKLDTRGDELGYSISVDNKIVMPFSEIGLRVDKVELGQDVKLGKPGYRKVDERYRLFGAHSVAVNAANEVTVPAVSHGQSFFVDLHVANDGVGVRLRLNARNDRHVEADRSTWHFEGNPTVWAAPLGPEYETPYKQMSLSELKGGSYGMPMTLKVNGLYVSLAEAGLKDFGDLALHAQPDGKLEGQLYADKDGWKTDGSVVQPWRVTVIARTLDALVNSTLVENLNPKPSDPHLSNANWIKPGRSTWQWLSSGDPVFSEQEQWVDWTKQLGFEYYLVDEGWERWQDPWGSLATTVAYADKAKVKIWIWVHSRYVADPVSRKAYFAKASALGIAGVKIDFPPPTNRAWSTWYFDVAKDAAAYHLMVDYHGASKPSGMERTWPNVLTREGVRGHEWQITRYKRQLEPDHDTILPFTRYVAGPGDYTPTVFKASELLGNTWPHELAQAIVFTSPFLCFGGHPKDYIENPAKDVLTAIPATWDETRVLEGSQPGTIVAEARRKGSQWFIAVINGGDTSHLNLPLAFLGKGQWKSSQLFDAAGNPAAWDRKDLAVTAKDSIDLSLVPRGGFVMWIRK